MLVSKYKIQVVVNHGDSEHSKLDLQADGRR
jgi:hypothetical protein